MERFCKALKEHVAKKINWKEEMKKESYIVGKSYVIYAKKDLALTMIIKDIVKSETIAITLENIDELLMIFAF